MALWRCVKCGGWGTAPIDSLSPVPANARPRWRVWGREDLVACPCCGDRKGHAGIMALGPDERSRLRGRLLRSRSNGNGSREEGLAGLLPVHRGAAVRAEVQLGAILDQLDQEITISQMVALRGYPKELAVWLAGQGVRWFEGETLQRLARKGDLEPVLRPLYRARGFLIPVRWWLPDGEGLALAGLQARLYGGEARYLTLRLFRDWTPPAGLILPPPERELHFPDKGEVILTEGWLKAATAAFIMGRPAVGFLGLPRKAQEVARTLKDYLGCQAAILAPDRDGSPGVRAHVFRAFRSMAWALFRVRVRVTWASWDPGPKGIDDALLAKIPVVISPRSPRAG